MRNNGTNSANMKQNNRQVLINLIRKKNGSRAELARLTGLTRAAVTLQVEEMIREGLFLETGPAEAEFGRKPVMLGLNPDYRYAAGIYLSRDFCSLGIVDLLGNVLENDQFPLQPFDTATECIHEMAQRLQTLLHKRGLSEERLLGIGVSTPGPVDIYRGLILNPPNFNKWHNIGIAEELGKEFIGKVLLDNNSAARALAEKSYGRGTGFHSFMLLVVNDGIGAGIILNDSLYRGAGGFGSEVGHTSVHIDGRRCDCGNRGCLELYASMPAVLEAFGEKGGNAASWKDIVDGALQRDPLCTNALEEEARYLAAGIVNAMNILELEAVILTGDINYKPELLLEKITSRVKRQAINRNINKLQLLQSSIAGDAGVLSAAAVILEDFFTNS